ncbi:T9SS type A sorting domain-containing protein [Ulvibacter antarcticus]|uniref:Putative secreted protein (Por secretion system target) n=1 Tax=Ulvibacter antarcticus TaxID=442714 RepID=A0A3L9Z4Q6_9FLAO|nr:T9SS type A sorting domain-containing protein [Ulvibacter antarcticus]RMA66439.1 putative secreted protein (Por secretion system target) [Ulvibacter antarcticus]
MKTKNYTLPVLFFFLFSTVLAQSHTWTGNGGDIDWFNSANWNSGTVPSSNSIVLIPSGFNVEIVTSIATAESIEMNTTSSLTLSNNLLFSGLWNINADCTVNWTSGTIQGGGIIENNSLFTMTTFDFKLISNITFNNYGMISIVQTNQNKASNGVVINNKPTGIMEIDSVGSWIQENTGNTINNEGVIRKIQTGTGFSTFYLIFDINNTGIIHAEQDQTFLILGGNITLDNMETGVISGSGIFDITANFTNNGSYSPGGENTIGTLEVVNNFSFGNNATIKIDIAGANPGEYDVIELTGSDNLEGVIELNLLSELSIGDELTILTTSNNSSCNMQSFVATNFNGNSYSFEVDCNPNAIVLRVNDILLDIGDFTSEAISFFVQPNPVTDEFRVILNASEEFANSSESLSLRIYNMLGQEVNRISNVSEESIIKRESLSGGLYLLQLTSESKVIATTKMLVQ